MSKEKFEKVLEEYKRRLSEYCLDGCSINCCDLTKFTVIIHNDDEISAIFDDEDPGDKVKPSLYYFYELDEYNGEVCRKFDPETKRCTIKNKQRPECCDTFPLQPSIKDQILIKESCQFTKSKKFKELQQFGQEQGIEVIIYMHEKPNGKN